MSNSNFIEGEQETLRAILFKIERVLKNHTVVVPLNVIRRLKKEVQNLRSMVDDEPLLR